MSIRPDSVVLLSVGLVVTAACSSRGSSSSATRAARPRAVPVETATVARRDMPVEIGSMGRVEPYDTVSVRSEVTARLVRAQARDGAFVKKNQPLFLLDDRQYVAAFQEAEANHEKDLAGLTQAEAQLARDQAEARYDRAAAGRQRGLKGRHLVSNDAAEQALAGDRAMRRSVDADRAAVAGAQAQIAAGKAALESARLQLAEAEIRAPIGGRLGDALVDEGNLVSADASELTTIADIDRVYVTFTIPGERVASIAPRMQERPLPVRVTPHDSPGRPLDGVLSLVDNAVDPSTDTIVLKATVPNADHRLWPGEFADVVLRVGTLARATVVPAAALNIGQNGPYVFVVRPNSTVIVRPVKTGTRLHDQVVVSGVAPGDLVVTSGQMQLEEGSRVVARSARPSGLSGGAHRRSAVSMTGGAG